MSQEVSTSAFVAPHGNEVLTSGKPWPVRVITGAGRTIIVERIKAFVNREGTADIADIIDTVARFGDEASEHVDVLLTNVYASILAGDIDSAQGTVQVTPDLRVDTYAVNSEWVEGMPEPGDTTSALAEYLRCEVLRVTGATINPLS